MALLECMANCRKVWKFQEKKYCHFGIQVNSLNDIGEFLPELDIVVNVYVVYDFC